MKRSLNNILKIIMTKKRQVVPVKSLGNLWFVLFEYVNKNITDAKVFDRFSSVYRCSS